MSVPPQVQALISQGRLEQADQLLDMLLQATPADAELWRARGQVALNLGRIDKALEASRRATELNALSAPAWAQLGSLEHAVGRLDLAERALQRACRIDHDPVYLTRLAAVLRHIGRIDEARDLLRQAVAARPGHAPAWQLCGEIALQKHDWSDAEHNFSSALKYEPKRAPTHYNLGMALEEQGRLEEACKSFDRAWELDSHLYAALAQSLWVRRRIALWDGLEALQQALHAAVQMCIPGISPFAYLSETDDPQAQLRCARTQAESIQRQLKRDFPDGLAPTPRSKAERPRVAFLSNGFAEHPTALLTVGLFENLPAERPPLLLYATNHDDHGPLRERLRTATDGFYDVHGWRSDRIARHMIEQQVDMLVDLRGWGGGASPEVLALRPAAIQLSWLAYPGSSGAPWIDYLIADRQTIPDGERGGYSEQIVRLPNCFQPSDTARKSGPAVTRRDLGLPSHGTVFASFNNRYKLNPEVWARWMEILREVPNSVLWLLSGRGLEQADVRLRAAAAAAQVDPERLHFLPKQPHQDYLSCLRLVDLFLDTWPYGAHTTASDALWSGVPVLTVPGHSFASRVATSQLRTLGLDELAADSVERYVDLAILIGRSVDLQAELRGKLAARRATSALFDMPRFAADFCKALELIWARHLRDEPPVDMDLPRGRG